LAQSLTNQVESRDMNPRTTVKVTRSRNVFS